MPSPLAPLRPRLPLLDQLRDADAASLRGDLVAGLSTAVMLVPQAMAYAMLAGLPPIVGLYASTLPVAVYALLGTSRQLAVGPVAMVSLLVASGVGAVSSGDPGEVLGLAALLALMVGVLQAGMGFARLGFLVKFLSHPVIAGFTSAAALIIGLSQLQHLLGLDLPRSQLPHEILLAAASRMDGIEPLTVALSAASLALLVGLKRLAPRVPRFLVVVVLGSLAAWGLGLDARGVAVVGEVPGGLPGLALPTLDLEAARGLLPMALTIALVGFMESISVAKAFARGRRDGLDADQELVALGSANVVGAFFQAYPVTGGFSRTAVNAQAGARTGLAGLVTAGAVVLTLLFLTPLFASLPKAVLAAIIVSAVAGLVDLEEARHLWRVSRPDLGLMALTFVATLGLGIEEGILTGVLASLAWFVWRTSRPHVAILGRLPGGTVYRNVERYPEAVRDTGVLSLRVDAPLYFANTAFLLDTVLEALDEAGEVEALVLDCKGIGSIDAQGLDTLGELLDELREREVDLWLAGVRGPVRDALRASGLAERIGEERLVERVHEAVDARLYDDGPCLRVVIR